MCTHYRREATALWQHHSVDSDRSPFSVQHPWLAALAGPCHPLARPLSTAPWKWAREVDKGKDQGGQKGVLWLAGGPFASTTSTVH